MRFRVLGIPASAAVAIVLSAGTARAFVPDPSSRALEFPLPYEDFTPVFRTLPLEEAAPGRAVGLGPGWMAQRDPRTGRIHAAYGGGVALAEGVRDEAHAVALARGFLLGQEALTGARAENLELRSVDYARGKYAVHFRQVLNGIPVRRADAFVLMSESGRLAAFGSSFFPEGDEIPAHPALTERRAVALAANALGTQPRPDRPLGVELFYVPAPSGELMELAPAYRVVFESSEPFGKWESFVHGLSGEILGRRNLSLPVNVVGTVEGDVQNQPPTHSYCDGSAVDPLVNLTVSVQGGGSGETDANGDFDISHGGTSPVTVQAELLGPFIDVDRAGGLGGDASVSATATPGTPVTLTFDGSNARQDERDTYVHGNTAHDFVTAIDPTFTYLDLPVVVVVGRSDYVCPGNAWWDLGGGQMNFCEAGGGYANTGEIGNVVYHEYGHGITEMVYSSHGASQPPSDLHEGNSDVVADFIDRNSTIGIGFFNGNCTSGIRDLNNSLQYPDDLTGEGHADGQIIGGFHWDSWQSLLGAKPQAEADSIAWSTWYFARDMGLPQNQPDQVLWTFMVDDDDGDLTNGTPNYDHFCLGAANHGFQCPEILTGVIITHTPLGHRTEPQATVVATITSTEAPLDPAELKVFYRLGGGGFSEILMSSTGNPDEYSAAIPLPLGNNLEVEYYISAMDLNGNSRTDPGTAPAVVHAFDVAFLYDDLEGDTSQWSVSSSASTGHWEVIDPIGTAAQPEDDATPAPGVLAFITGQCSGPNCPSGCTLGCNDIDNGTTTLYSPVYDLTGALGAKIKYDRWYSNNTGANPGTEPWVVDVSNDGGSSWTNVENTLASSAKWETHSIDIDSLFGTPGQVQVRFIGSDLASNGGSLVEAGVDEIRVLASFEPPNAAPEGRGAAEPLAFSLSQNRPNPFRPETRIEFSIPERSEVTLAVYNVMGRAVRELVSGVREAGRYSVRWNGRDAQGERVSAGVYFYRLSAGDRVITRKMTVLQ